MKRAKPTLHAEIKRTSKSVAEEIYRYRKEPSDIFLDAVTNRVERALDFYEDIVANIVSKSIPDPQGGSYTLAGREAHRNHEMKSLPGCGFGCDVCGGGFDTPTFMTLRIGSYKARLLIDLCRPCTKRLSSIVDARLEDGRLKENG